jgi:hypothetical protein
MTKTPEHIERSPAGAENPLNIQLKHEEKMLQELLGNTLLKAVDQWIAGQNDPAFGRSEAIRRLVELGLKAKGK